jgi:hypothetical protein
LPIKLLYKISRKEEGHYSNKHTMANNKKYCYNKLISSSIVGMSEKSWNQVEEFIWKWYPVLIGAALFEDTAQKKLIT